MGYLRDATMQDAELLFAWANESSVREQSFCTDRIGFYAHMEWMAHMLAQKNARQYIFMCGSTPAGQARVTVNGEEADIGYSVCLEKRCMGYGTEMLGLLVQQVEKDFPSVKRLCGKVKPGNIASQKAFLNAGYVDKYHAFELELGQQPGC